MKPRRARFRVRGWFSGAREATVTITVWGDSALFAVRPLRRRREYVLPLATVADHVVWKVVKSEVAARPRKRR